MALVSPNSATFSLTFLDRDQNKSVMSLNVPADIASTDILDTLSTSLAATIAGVSDATLIAVTYSKTWKENNPALAVEGSDVERKGVFSCIDAAGRALTIAVPSIKNTLVVDKSKVIDLAALPVAAFVTYLTSGALGFLQPQSVHGDDITQVTNAEKHHRASSKG